MLNNTQLLNLIATNITTGGRNTFAQDVRDLMNEVVDSFANLSDGGDVYQVDVGYSFYAPLTSDKSFTHRKYVDDLVSSAVTNPYSSNNGITNNANVFQLGGALNQHTNITGAVGTYDLNFGNALDRIQNFGVYSSSSTGLNFNNGSVSSSFEQNGTNVQIYQTQGVDTTALIVDHQAAKIFSVYAGFQGFQEYADYSANYGALSLVNKTYVDGLVVGLLDDRGNHDASGNLFPSTGGSGNAGAILKGDLWYISVAGTLGGTPVNIGDSIRTLVDAPGQTAGNWNVLESNIGFVPENVANKATSFAVLNNTLYPTTQAVSTLIGGYVPYTAATTNVDLGTFSLTSPLIIGGSAVGSVIQYKGTSGNGTSTVAAHQFLVGNNGATTAMSVYNSGNINIGNATNTSQRLVRIGQDTAFIDFGSYTLATGNAALYFNAVTPGSTNFGFVGNTASTQINGPTTSVVLSIANQSKITVGLAQNTFTPAAASSGVLIAHSFSNPANTGITASTNVPYFKVTGNTQQWATGTLAIQYFNYFSANAVAFVGASTATNVYGLYCETPLAGTNATITNAYAIGTDGAIRQTIGTGNIQLSALTTNANVGVIYLNQATPSGTNYSLASTNASTTYLNGVSATQISVNTNLVAYYNSYSARWEGGAYSGLIGSDLWWCTAGTGSNLTASTELTSYAFNSASMTFLAGALTTQRKLRIKSDTIAFASSSTLTNYYALYVEAATAGSNATITNNYALGLSGSLSLVTAGNGIFIKEGTNATMGNAVLVAGTVVVNTTKVTANSRIFLTAQNNGGTVGAVSVSARTPGTSFTITSLNVLDTSTIGWIIMEPTP